MNQDFNSYRIQKLKKLKFIYTSIQGEIYMNSHNRYCKTNKKKTNKKNNTIISSPEIKYRFKTQPEAAKELI